MLPGSDAPVPFRPLCRYPTYARYDGSGDPNRASSFTCSRGPFTLARADGARSGARTDTLPWLTPRATPEALTVARRLSR